FLEDDGRKRQVFAGLIPVSNREQYIAASESKQAGSSGAPATDTDARVVLFQKVITGPWKALTDQAAEVKTSLGTPPSPPPPDKNAQDAANAAKASVKKAARERIQVGSWYVLLDFAKFLQQYLPNVWAVVSGAAPASGLSSSESAFLTALSTKAPSER